MSVGIFSQSVLPRADRPISNLVYGVSEGLCGLLYVLYEDLNFAIDVKDLKAVLSLGEVEIQELFSMNSTERAEKIKSFHRGESFLELKMCGAKLLALVELSEPPSLQVSNLLSYSLYFEDVSAAFEALIDNDQISISVLRIKTCVSTCVARGS